MAGAVLTSTNGLTEIAFYIKDDVRNSSEAWISKERNLTSVRMLSFHFHLDFPTTEEQKTLLQFLCYFRAYFIISDVERFAH